MLDLAPPAGFIPPPSAAVNDVATGLGWSFVDAIVDGDFDRLQTLFTPDVRFRAIIPDEYQEASTAAGARALIEDWFSGTNPRELRGWTVDLVGDRVALGYRLELTEAGERRIVEQHVAAAFDGASFRDLALVCSGFRPLAPDTDGAAARMGGDSATEHDRPAGEPALTPSAHLDATGLSCATLTPTISAAVRGLDFGAVLEIVTDDPEAEEGLRSWTRLTGNEFVSTEAGRGSARRFHIRRSPRDAATTKKGTD
jgi:TusA-related sulfurtransferase